MANQTPRLNTPYIISTQSQKDVTHNTALNMLDALVQPAVETSILSIPPVSPTEGDLWVVSGGATGAWATHDNELTQFIGGIWVFYLPFEGMQVWLKDELLSLKYVSGIWEKAIVRANAIKISGIQILGPQQAAISDAAAGSTIDAEARSALNSLLAVCRTHGLIAP